MARNIVPPEFQVVFDIRVAPPTDIKEFEETLRRWIEEAEDNEGDSGRITYEFKCVSQLIKLVNCLTRFLKSKF